MREVLSDFYVIDLTFIGTPVVFGYRGVFVFWSGLPEDCGRRKCFGCSLQRQRRVLRRVTLSVGPIPRAPVTLLIIIRYFESPATTSHLVKHIVSAPIYVTESHRDRYNGSFPVPGGATKFFIPEKIKSFLLVAICCSSSVYPEMLKRINQILHSPKIKL